MLDKALFIVLFVLIVVFGILKVEFTIVLYVVTKLISLVFLCYNFRSVFCAPLLSLSKTFVEMLVNVKAGINLMFSNIAGMLIVGLGRQMVDMSMGLSSFGRISFSMALTNFFIQFIAQTSMVLFPALRRMDGVKQKTVYQSLRVSVSSLLPLAFVVYLPIKFFLVWWLPDYVESLIFMGFLLPICINDGKMNLICYTYFKVLRKERYLLLINIMTLFLSAVLCALGAFVFKSLWFIVFSLDVAIFFRSVVAEWYLSSLLGVPCIQNLVFETSLMLLFLALIIWASDTTAFVVILIAYTVFLLSRSNSLLEAIRLIREGV
jgi:hypothetical protein